MKTATQKNYSAFDHAYMHFNKALFSNQLPDCLITLQRKAKSFGYFHYSKFGSLSGYDEQKDELALNPHHFFNRTTEAILSTLAHEMCHLWQYHHGKPTKGYHNKEWAAKMESIGLIPSSTGAPGGKKTGQKMTHYIEENGLFAKSCKKLLDTGFTIPYGDIINDDDKPSKPKAQSKVKFSCPECGQAAWGKPSLLIICGDCEIEMQSS